MIKMFGWESRIQERIAVKRESEIDMIWKRRLAELGANLCGVFLPTLTMTVTFAVHTVIQKQTLTSAKGELIIVRNSHLSLIPSLYQYDHLRPGQGTDGFGQLHGAFIITL